MDLKLQILLKDLKKHGIDNNIPNVTEHVGQLLNMLVRVRSPKNILEIGCANGYSTIWMANALHKASSTADKKEKASTTADKKVRGKIHAIDHSKPTFEEAKRNLIESGLQSYVNFYFGDAIDVIGNFPSDLLFDFVFVDGEKGSYLDFWNAIKPKLSEKSVIVFDDMVLFPEKTKSFSKAIKNESNFDQLLIPDGNDGILMLIKG